MTSNLFRAFKLLLGKGRAFNLCERNISNFSLSLLTPFKELQRRLQKLALTPFPSQNQYNTEAELLEDIVNFEKQFNLTNTRRMSINERAGNIEAQFGMVGGQSYQYLETALQNAGIPARVIENIPAQDLLAKDLIEYGFSIYGEVGAMYGASGYLTIGNGNLQLSTTEINDPVRLSNSNLSSVFLITGEYNTTLQLTGGQYDLLENLIIKLKPLQLVALVKANLH